MFTGKNAIRRSAERPFDTLTDTLTARTPSSAATPGRPSSRVPGRDSAERSMQRRDVAVVVAGNQEPLGGAFGQVRHQASVPASSNGSLLRAPCRSIVSTLLSMSRERIDERIDEAVLALLYLEIFEREPMMGARTWKSLDWDAMERLHRKGLTSDPVSKAKSVVFTDAGLRRAEAAFRLSRRMNEPRSRRSGRRARPRGHPRVAERTCPAQGRPSSAMRCD